MSQTYVFCIMLSACFVPYSGVAPLGPQIRMGNESVHHDAAEPESGQVADVIDVQMPDENLVQVVVWDLLGRDPRVAAAPNIEEKLVAVSQLDQPAGGRLLGPSTRHAGTQGNDPHLVRLKILGARVVHVALGCGNGFGGRPRKYNKDEQRRTSKKTRNECQAHLQLHRNPPECRPRLEARMSYHNDHRVSGGCSAWHRRRAPHQAAGPGVDDLRRPFPETDLASIGLRARPGTRCVEVSAESRK